MADRDLVWRRTGRVVLGAPLETEPRSVSLALLIALTAVVASCKRSPAPSTDTIRGAPVPPPAGLVAEIIVAHPDRTWDTVRAKLRATTALVPSSPAVFLGGALGLPLGVLEQLDFNIPIVGAVVEEGDCSPRSAPST
jgi:hypothetical protein